MCHYNGRVGITKGVHLLDHLINNYTTSSHSPNVPIRHNVAVDNIDNIELSPKY